MMRFCLSGDWEQLRSGLALIAPDLKVELCSEGFPLSVSMREDAPQTLSIRKEKACASIVCVDKASFFRALTILCAHMEEQDFSLTETRKFDRDGVLFDCSRNAVLSPNMFRYILRRMAMMGHTWAMLYTEETYAVDGEPFFGYCRGKYTEDELRALDDYAYSIGIELVPAIQTLAHLERFLHWPEASKYRDTGFTLRVGSDDVYDLLKRMIVSASRPYRTKRIHICMDEARDLGRGNSLDIRGFIPPATLMAEHLRRVREILNELGLHAMMWSDMHFENAGPGGYYSETKTFTDEIVNSAPEDIDLVYWDYYHETEKGYDRMLRWHEPFKAKKIFAGGVWIWSGLTADYEKTLAATEPALKQAYAHGVREVFATAWGDNGGECPMSAALYGLQLYAEFDYAGDVSQAHLAKRFVECVGMDPAAFLRMSDIQKPIRFHKVERDAVNLCKPLLYEDPLIPLFEKDFGGHDLVPCYAALKADYDRFTVLAPEELKPSMAFHAALADVLRLKCHWRQNAAKAVRNQDRAATLALTQTADEILPALERLADAWRSVWFYENKSYGFEIIDIRIGAQIARFKSAKLRMLDFAQGTIDDIPELTEEKLPLLVDENGVYHLHYEIVWWTGAISACSV